MTNKPTREEIEYKLMEIFNKVSVDKEVRKAATYILTLLKKAWIKRINSHP